MGLKPNFTIIEDTEERILLLDVGPWITHLSITNGAEQVVEELAPTLNGRRLFYLDTDGYETELLHKDGKFVGFGFPVC